MNMDKTVKCPICKDPYKITPFYSGDQSACPECRAKADRKILGVKRDWAWG